MLDVNKLPKKLNEYNYFEKQENGGCILYSYSQKNDVYIISVLEDFEIEKSFCVDEQAMKMLKLLSPITEMKLDTQFYIKSKKGKYKAQFVAFDKPIIKDDYDNEIKVNLSILNKAMNFVSNKPQRPCLCGVNVNSCGNILATDSYIAFYYQNQDDTDITTLDITLPTDFIKYLNEAVDSDVVDIKFNEMNCMVKDGNNTYISRLIAGNYPDMTKILNGIASCNPITFDYEDLKEKLNLASNIIGEKGSSQILTFANDYFKAEGNDSYEAELKGNTEVEYQFSILHSNLKPIFYCLDGNNNNLSMYYKEPLKPIYFKEGKTTYLALPLKK